MVSSLVNMHVRVQVDSFCLTHFSPNQNDAVSLIISGKQVKFLHPMPSHFYIRKARQKPLFLTLGKANWFELSGGFKHRV